MIRHTNKHSSESWEFLPWKKFQVNLFRLQKRVYKAVRAEDDFVGEVNKRKVFAKLFGE